MIAKLSSTSREVAHIRRRLLEDRGKLAGGGSWRASLLVHLPMIATLYAMEAMRDTPDILRVFVWRSYCVNCLFTDEPPSLYPIDIAAPLAAAAVAL